MTYQEEQDLLFSSTIENIYFKNFFTIEQKNSESIGLELIVTPECNLNCAYCYLNANKDLLYPKEIRDKNTILNNLILLLNYLEEKKVYIPEIEVYSGEIWHTEFGIKILTVLTEKLKVNKICEKIVIPSNMTFVLYKDKMAEIEKIMQDCEKNNIKILWSASIDGKIIEDKFRPFNNLKPHTDKFYDEIFKFKQRHPTMGFHPMVSSKSCKYWIDNYNWFHEQFIKYYNDDELEPMMLEVRNPDWTDEDIEYYKQFVDFLIDNQKKKSTSLQDFSQRMFRYGKYTREHGCVSYVPYILSTYSFEIPCSIQTYLQVRLGDLALPLCHRLSYDNLIAGNFVVENNKITGIKSNRPETFIYIKTMNPIYNHLKCDRCRYKNLCMKGCLGAQYESFSQLNLPCENICHFLQEKIDFLVDRYNKEKLISQLGKDVHTEEFAMRQFTYETIVNFLQQRGDEILT